MRTGAERTDHMRTSLSAAVDPVIAFEEYWGASKYRTRNMIGYSDKKCLAWEAFQQGISASVDERPEGQDPKGLGAQHASAVPERQTPTPSPIDPLNVEEGFRS